MIPFLRIHKTLVIIIITCGGGGDDERSLSVTTHLRDDCVVGAFKLLHTQTSTRLAGDVLGGTVDVCRGAMKNGQCPKRVLRVVRFVSLHREVWGVVVAGDGVRLTFRCVL